MYTKYHCGKNPNVVCSAATYGALDLPCNLCEEWITKEEKDGALYNLKILTQTKDSWTWEQLAEFLHYVSINNVKSIMRYLQTNGDISYIEHPKKITCLKIVKIQ